jgi:hypothetical protein
LWQEHYNLTQTKKKGNSNEDKTAAVNAGVFLTLSAILMAAQMQMPARTPWNGQAAEASTAPKTSHWNLQ